MNPKNKSSPNKKFYIDFLFLNYRCTFFRIKNDSGSIIKIHSLLINTI